MALFAAEIFIKADFVENKNGPNENTLEKIFFFLVNPEQCNSFVEKRLFQSAILIRNVTSKKIFLTRT